MKEQNTVAGVIGSVLLFRGFLGFVSSPVLLFGVFSTTMNHNFLHILVGCAYVWVAVWAPSEKTACGWNKFLGWLYAIIAILGIMNVNWMSSNTFYGVNTLADNIFNIVIALGSLSCGYHFHKVKRAGTNFMKALNYPFGKT